MKILWHSAHPDQPTGYGQQTALVVPRLQALGYDMAISLTFGVSGQPAPPWRGIPVFPTSGLTDIGEDTVGPAYGAWEADLCITFMCTWRSIAPPLWRNLRTLHWMNVDCDPMSWADYKVIADTGGMPAATSRRGWEIMRKGGKTPERPHDLREPLDPLYLPHGIDLKCFSPVTDARRTEMRKAMGMDGKFVVGMNFNNSDRYPDRKNVARAIRGFADFRRTHPDAYLFVHSIERTKDGYHLPALLEYFGLAGAAELPPQWEYATGMIPPAAMADLYRVQDVYLGVGNEGVGLPGLEAQACGTPAILLDAQSGPEVAGKHSWLVGGHPEYNEVHRADWLRADSGQITAALCEAYEDARNRREAVREHASGWDINRVVRDHWEPALAELS